MYIHTSVSVPLQNTYVYICIICICIHVYTYISVYIYTTNIYIYTYTTCMNTNTQWLQIASLHNLSPCSWDIQITCICDAYIRISPPHSRFWNTTTDSRTQIHTKKKHSHAQAAHDRARSRSSTRGGGSYTLKSPIYTQKSFGYTRKISLVSLFDIPPTFLYTHALCSMFSCTAYIFTITDMWLIHLRVGCCTSLPVHIETRRVRVCVCVCVYACVCTFMSSFRSFCSSNLSSTADARRSATPPPGTMPSSTAARVALSASTKRSFRSPTSTCNNVCVSARERERRVKSGEGERESEREKER